MAVPCMREDYASMELPGRDLSARCLLGCVLGGSDTSAGDRMKKVKGRHFGKATRVYYEDGWDGVSVRVVYHSTSVVTASKSQIILMDGGWKTATTRRRMNQAAQLLDLGFKVYQKAFDWFVLMYGQAIPYENGMIIARTKQGEVVRILQRMDG